MRLARNCFWLPFVALFALILSGCRHGETVNPTPTVLVSSTELRNFPSTDLQLFLSLSGLKVSPSSLKYYVAIYKVTYNTTFNGKNVVGSGLVALPETTVPVGMLSFQHGTIVAHDDAPSALSASSPDLVLYAALASPGFVAVIPDYVGFGASADILHPYYVRDATSTAILDLIRAARELTVLKKVNFNGKLFLAGYSEGGYATMAAHRAIEQKGLAGFDLMASFPAAGGYDVMGMRKYFFGLSTYGQPFFIAYAAMAYQNNYGWTAPLSKFFQEPYASIIPGLFDGSKDGSQINAQLTTNISQLVATDLLAHIDTDSQYKYITDAFKENSLLDWKPTIKMFLYHGDADTTVPFQNSVNTYNQLIANGATTDIVTLSTLAGKDHETGVQPYIEDIISKLLSMQ